MYENPGGHGPPLLPPPVADARSSLAAAFLPVRIYVNKMRLFHPRTLLPDLFLKNLEIARNNTPECENFLDTIIQSANCDFL